MDLVLPGRGCVSFGRDVQPADSQPRWDRCDRKLTGAPCLPPGPVFAKFGRNPCSGRQSSPADHLRCVNGKEHSNMSRRTDTKQSKSVVSQTLKRGFYFPPRSKVEPADTPWTPLCDRQRAVIPLQTVSALRAGPDRLHTSHRSGSQPALHHDQVAQLFYCAVQ